MRAFENAEMTRIAQNAGHTTSTEALMISGSSSTTTYGTTKVSKAVPTRLPIRPKPQITT